MAGDLYTAPEWMPLLFKGERPGEKFIAAAPLLSDWRLEFDDNPGTWTLEGAVFCHPKHRNGKRISVEHVHWIDPQLEYALAYLGWFRLAALAEAMT